MFTAIMIIGVVAAFVYVGSHLSQPLSLPQQRVSDDQSLATDSDDGQGDINHLHGGYRNGIPHVPNILDFHDSTSLGMRTGIPGLEDIQP